MEQYNVTGMSCAACSARVEKAVTKVPGVESCAVSLLTNSMGVEGSASPEAIIRAVESAGYGASLKKKRGSGNSGVSGGGKDSSSNAGSVGGGKAGGDNSGNYPAADDDPLKDTETPKLRRRLALSAVFLLVLMYFSMGHMMLSLPIPAFFENHVALALLEMLIATVVMIINQKFFTSGFRALFSGSPNMDTLVALGSTASFGYSLVELFLMIDAQGAGDHARVMSLAHNLYFESAAMIPTLITIGKMLEAMSKGKTTDALRGLMKLAPQTAVVVRDDEEMEVPIGEVLTGDIFAVRPGGSIPVDGVVAEGTTSVNESALTGESIPVDKQPGDNVCAATINLAGYIRCRATRVGEDTTLSQIIQMVSDAASTKAEIARIADKVSGIFVPAVMGIALFTFIVWMVAGKGVTFAIARAISVLVISCPCALGLATPVAIMVGNGVGAKNGILFKTAVALEKAGKMQIAALDKTGTITLGEPKVTDVLPAEGISEEQLLRLAASLEQHSEHPLAKAVIEEAEKRGITPLAVTEFSALPGNGLTARLAPGGQETISDTGLVNERAAASYISGEDALIGGSYSFISSRIDLKTAAGSSYELLSGEGKTPLFFAVGGRYAGIIAVADVIKEDSPEAVRQLQNLGVEVVMLTGDNERTAEAIGRQAGVDRVIAGVLPDGKEKIVRELAGRGSVVMVGDGINDAPALTRADLGIAIGAGADIAIDAADVVLMKSRLADVPAAIRLSRQTVRNIHENLFWAFFYNIICIPLAAGFYQQLFGLKWEMNPMIGAAAMSLSSFCVCMNALRLNLYDIHDPKRDRKIAPAKPAEEPQSTKRTEVSGESSSDKEVNEMTKTMKIEGMMCVHCEATVKKALEAIDGVSEAVVSHEAGTAVVTLGADVSDEALTKAVEEKDYKVISVE